MIRNFIVFGIFLILSGVGLYSVFTIYMNKTISLERAMRIEIAKGSSLHRVARDLKKKNIIVYPRLFVKGAQIYGYSDSIKYGEYELQPGQSYRQVLENFVNGKTYQYKITFVEGEHMFHYAKQVAEKGLGSEEEFLSLVRDRKWIKELTGEDLESLEGYLFPETYSFSKQEGVKKIIAAMVKMFFNKMDGVSYQASGLSRHQLITLASIVEKETGAAFERPMISSVFHNRLKKKMRLQTDPTIIYGILRKTGREIKNIRKSDIRNPTEYNTYVISGLPPGPIGNPGIEAIQAAANPQSTPYLYFVSQNDGTHIFSKNYGDHQKAVRKFQLNPKMRKGKSWRDLKQKRAQ